MIGKRYTAWLLILVVFSSSSQTLFICADYRINHSYIASTLCENRSKSWMHCNGRCYLMKKIRQAEQKRGSAERQMQVNLLQEAFFSQPHKFNFFSHLLRRFAVRGGPDELTGISFPIFRPPIDGASLS